MILVALVAATNIVIKMEPRPLAGALAIVNLVMTGNHVLNYVLQLPGRIILATRVTTISIRLCVIVPGKLGQGGQMDFIQLSPEILELWAKMVFTVLTAKYVGASQVRHSAPGDTAPGEKIHFYISRNVSFES